MSSLHGVSSGRFRLLISCVVCVCVCPATRFMAYHTSLTNSQEFTRALEKARELAHNITMGMRKIPGTSPDFEVFPYT